MNLSLYLFAGLTVFSTLVLLGYLVLPKESPKVLQRLVEVTRTGSERTTRVTKTEKIGELSARAAAWFRAHLWLTEDPGLRTRFACAGLKGARPGDLYHSARILGPLLLLLIGSLIPYARFFWMAALPAIAYLAPDLVLARLIRTRSEHIRKSIPDVIDLLVICVDAGLGLDQAMLRVAQELSISHPETSDELLHINREQRAGRPRNEAWQSMADRVKVEELDALVNMLLQTERFGTPIAKALGTFAQGVRTRRRQKAEEMAAKSTVKIIFPLVIFIFPAIFVVLLGPAILNIMHVLADSPK
jgi:tight adherence protein C